MAEMSAEANAANRAFEQLPAIFLCGARDFHAIDWYRSAVKVLNGSRPLLITDLIGGEGFQILVDDKDHVVPLIILDRILFQQQSRYAHLWRNAIKATLFPIQVLLLRLRSRKHLDAVFYAHSMYYLWLAWAARLRYVGTPQGSDVLLKPFRSFVFRELSKRALQRALFVTVDSRRMAQGVKQISGVSALVVQNGIDIPAILKSRSGYFDTSKDRRPRVASIRGFTPLYRIAEVVSARNRSANWSHCSIEFVYPFYDSEYLKAVSTDLHDVDVLIGRLDRSDLYELLSRMLFVISIPSSDSSPRTVYEAIFCGTPVAVVNEGYLQDLPRSMRERIIVVDLNDTNWFDSAASEASRIRQSQFVPCAEALLMFDQVESFRRIHNIATAMLQRTENSQHGLK